ncbi:unnamed protein product [Cochlearia groenlandica]
MERYAFKGVASNLVTYLTEEVKMSNSRAAKTVNTWAGFTSMLPLFSAPLADAYWDTFFTILSSSSLYFLGLVGLTWTAFAGSRSATKTISTYFLYSSLCLVSIGLGVLNPSLQAFGADQLDHQLHKDSDELLPSDAKSTQKTQFFQWWYFGVCTGSLMGVTFMAYVQDTFGWVLGFAVPGIAIFLSILFFLSGYGIYVYAPPCTALKMKTTPTTPFDKILKFIKARFIKQRSKYSLADQGDLDAMELELQEKPLCKCDSTETEDIEAASTITKGMEDEKSAKTEVSGLDNVKLVLRLLPIWTMLLMFAVIFQQPATFFTKQGMTMKRNIGSSFKIPPATLQSTITLSIILLMPLYDKILIPVTKRIKKNGKGITVMERMGVGMLLSIIAIVIAAIVERKRLEISKKMKNLREYDMEETIQMSIMWLLPQYVLLGISDIFTVVGMQEFFYSEVPVRMRTMGFALYTSVFGVGSFVSAGIITIVEAYSCTNWFADDMSEARLDKYYWLLAGTSTVSFGVYIVLCNYFKSSEEKQESMI